MELSLRLRTIADLVPLGTRLADIGTDHGYIPITLLKEGRIPWAVAMDIGKGPLSRARQHGAEQGLLDKIELRLSDGFEALREGEADTAVIAGMGGLLMVKILEAGLPVVKGLDTLILSPQSDLGAFRSFLLEKELAITQEVMVLDEGKYYTIMVVRPGEAAEEPWTEAELLYGKHLIREKSPVFLSYLEKERETLGKIKEKLLSAATEKAQERLSELSRKEALLEEALGRTDKE